MSYVDEVIERVIKENPAEPEFHQAVKEVLESLRVVVDVNEKAFRRDALLERLVNPERQIKFRVPWIDDKGQVHINTGSQTLTLKHEAHSRALFAEGALKAAEYLRDQTAGLYSVGDLFV